ncbi:hypothetical protein KC902_00200 [Candidatus Kaiserbacteria bacterium]|nr:hypothetical protein [Candidatus Kaiserbacteria bacterium]USN88652.1 MAG: hypothetical protein H6780_04155 [Candidatus Nomurabacteria bacterium]
MLWRKRFWSRCIVPVAGLLLALVWVEAIRFAVPLDRLISVFTLVQAAEVTIDSAVSTTPTEHHILGSQTVFVSDQVGYKFYTNSNGTCVYNKTSNGGTSWGTEVTFDSQTDCWGVVVWYDQWTAGDTGNYIHIISADSSSDVVWYNRLDTTSDTLLLGSTPVNVSSNSGQTGTLATAANNPSITKATNGVLYIAIADNTDSYVVECSASCGSATSWTETGTNPMDLQPDKSLILPLADGDIILIQRDRSADDMRSKIWDDSAGTWSGTWTIIDANAIENSTYDPSFAAMADPDSGDIFLVYIDNGTTGAIGGGNDNIRTAKYSGGSWTNTANVVTNSAMGLTKLSMAMDGNNSEIYVAFSARVTPGTANTANIYWATSTAAMSSWGSVQGPVNSTPDDMYGVDLNNYNKERIYVSWYQPAIDDILGDTIANISPITVVSSFGTQSSEVRASSTDTYIGGGFAIVENSASRNVTDIIISENGSVDAANALDNIKLYYDLDTSAPYDCASESYSGTESQFGSTDTNGFSGADGVSAFTGSVGISPTTAMCVYVVMDVLKVAVDGSTLDVEISNPATDVLVSGSVTAVPPTAQQIGGTTNIVDSDLTQTHYHWRNDDNIELLATSRTGGAEDIPLTALQKETPVRLRFGVSNEGSTTTLPTTLRLEYATNPSVCSAATGWTDIDVVDDAWNLYDSTYVVNGTDTTDISVASGGVDNENSVFLTPNGGQLDTSSETGSLAFLPTNWTEVEYAIVASSSAQEGDGYCFRLTNAGEPLPQYNTYPSAVIAADVRVRATSTQIAAADIPADNVYLGGAFTITENSSARTVSGITITENGTVDASAGLANIRLYYDLDTSAPYDCASESYSGTEFQYGATSSAFSAANGTSTFSDAVGITTTQTMCVYVVADVTETAQNGENINILLASPATDIVVSGGGTVSPSTPLDINGSTTLAGAIVTQTGYHWRYDDGDETSSGATSATGGAENTALADLENGSAIRLRMQISNEGSTTSVPRQYGLEYGVKSTTCDAISVWTDVDGGGLIWAMSDSSNLTHGADTTDVSVGSGGVSNPGGKTFLTPNGGVRDISSFSATTTLTNSQFTEFEYSITTTEDTPYETDFCFRLTQNGSPLLAYTQYAELNIEPKRDFKIQQGESIVSGTGLTLTAGVDYEAPSSASTAFVRITNSHMTGAGRDAAGGAQNADDYGAYISNPANLTTSFTISRDTDSINNTYVAWEIIEYVGAAGGDNEIIVRDQSTLSLGTTANTATGSAVPTVADDADVVVFITGQMHHTGNRTETYSHQFTSTWSAGSGEPTFERGDNGGNAAEVSYAVVEFTGLNWKVQRTEHNYAAAGVTETEPITAVNSLGRTFIHAQKRYTAVSGIGNVGHEVWLSSIGAVSFEVNNLATITGVTHTSVAWIIENTQTGTGAMSVQRSSGNTTGGTEPVLISLPISTSLNSVNNASIFVTTDVNQTGDTMPRPIAGAFITSTSTYQLWRSEASGGGVLSYRTEIVQWPAADLAIRQNYYRLYADNDDLTPSDPWPIGAYDLGENAPITAVDEPPADGGHIRVRMTLQIANATLPSGFLTTKLQYGELETTCSAVSVWSDVGAAGSGAIWRGYDAAGIVDGASLSGNPPTGGDLLISVADRAGRYTESNPSSANQYATLRTEDIEYDWHIEHNGAPQRTTYCFRMVKADDTELDGYFYYPQIRTEGYSPATQNWRWYDDETNETPSLALAAENVTPTGLPDQNEIKLRISLTELKNLSQLNARFKLQYSESPNFGIAYDLSATTSCTASSLWCYADGAGVDTALITTSVLSDSDGCVAGVGDGCGTHNEAGYAVNGFTHYGNRTIENEFTIKYSSATRNFGKVYYFRLYDVTNDEPVAVNNGYTIPSIGVDPTSLTLSVNGVNSGTSIAGITTDVTTTATGVDFGSLPVGSSVAAAQDIDVSTNATEGYQLLVFNTQGLLNSYGDAINPIASTNAAPQGWTAACDGSTGCFGYHTTDATLWGGSTRFAPIDSYAPLSTSPEEIMYNSASSSESHSIIYRVSVTPDQPAGDYTADLQYIVIPVF